MGKYELYNVVINRPGHKTALHVPCYATSKQEARELTAPKVDGRIQQVMSPAEYREYCEKYLN